MLGERQRLEKVNFNIILRIVKYLSFRDVYALSVTSRTLRELCNSCEIWMSSARDLVQNGIGLPTNGFRKPDDLSSEELRASIVKARNLDNKWNRCHADYVSFTSFDTTTPSPCPENTPGNAIQANAKTSTLLPVTSNFLLVVDDNHSRYAAWDISDFESPKMLGNTRTAVFQSLFAHVVDLKNSCTYLLMGPYQSIGAAHAASLMEVNFASQGTATFKTIANYPSFSENGFLRLSANIMDVERKSLCIAYVKDFRIYLYVVLDWDLGSVAFVDTHVEVSHSVSFNTVHCVLLRHLGIVMMQWEEQEDSDVYRRHGFLFEASKFYPCACHVGELTGERLNDLPLVHPEVELLTPEPTLPRNIEQIVMPTPWHAYRDFRPRMHTSIFKSFSSPVLFLSHHYKDFRGKPSRGSQSIHVFHNPARLSVQFGGAAWADTSQPPFLYELYVARYVPGSPGPLPEYRIVDSADGQEGIPISEGCLLTLPSALQDDVEGLPLAQVNVVLDNVHGKIYFALPGGKTYVVAYV